MADARHGYDVSIGYTANFFPQMAPHWLDFCIRAQGFDRQQTSPSYRYLDLGCGQGFHLCLLAAANPQAEFVGIDFDAAHIAHAQELADTGGLTNARFIRADFLDLATDWPKELGSFDYMVLQGIVSWVSPELRAAVFGCVTRASKEGTVAFFGYNSPPGWLSSIPFQHVTNQFGKDRDPQAAIQGAIALFRRISATKGPLSERMPHFKTHLEVIAAQSTNYLAHELLTDNWQPLWHSQVAGQLRSAGFTYVGSASAAEALLPDALPPDLAAIVRQYDGSLREDVQDIVTMRTFRRDIFARDARRAEHGVDANADVPIYLMSAPPEGAPVEFQTSFGGLGVPYPAVADIVAALADGPKPLAALMALKNPARPSPRTILLSMLEMQMLVVGSAAPASSEIAMRFNAALARTASAGRTYHHLAAPKLGSGARVTALDLLMLDCWLSNDRGMSAQDLAKRVAERLKVLGSHLQFRGGAIPDEQLHSHILPLAPAFIDRTLPRWRALGVID